MTHRSHCHSRHRRSSSVEILQHHYHHHLSTVDSTTHTTDVELRSFLRHHDLPLAKPQARERTERDGFDVSLVKISLMPNTKALGENEGKCLVKVSYHSTKSIDEPIAT